jgi:hypothetical protein
MRLSGGGVERVQGKASYSSLPALIIVVTGTDGYVSVFTAGEIDPGRGGNHIMVAYEDNGQPLGCEGPAEIVAPGDKADVFVHNIATMETAQ